MRRQRVQISGRVLRRYGTAGAAASTNAAAAAATLRELDLSWAEVAALHKAAKRPAAEVLLLARADGMGLLRRWAEYGVVEGALALAALRRSSANEGRR